MNKKQAKRIHAVIPAAGKPTNKILSNSNLPDTMIPINGKPIIGYILEDLMTRGIFNITIVLNNDDATTENYVKKCFKDKCKVQVVYNSNNISSIGNSVFMGVESIQSCDSLLIYLGDTIYKSSLTFDKDFLVVSKSFEEPDKWCFVEEKKGELVYINKPKTYKGNGHILSGIYFFRDYNFFKKCLSELNKKNPVFEIKDILEKYQNKYTFTLENAKKWYDCGNIENYYNAKIDFLKLRNFNKLTYNDLYGYITKSGNNSEKILAEINWYRNIPHSLQIFFPRLINFKESKSDASYSLEYYGYPSLADLFVFNSLDIRVWKGVIERLFKIVKIFKTNKKIISYKSYYNTYVTKTSQRLDELKKDEFWEELLSYEDLVINGKVYKNFSYFAFLLENKVKDLFMKTDMSFMHGDMCMSNILFDPTSRIFKFVDPKGKFGKLSIYGDIKYDVAKLRHSFRGLYDFIISDLFDIEQQGNKFDFNVYTDVSHKEIGRLFDKELVKNGFDLKQIKFIEGLLFISMISLHRENKKQQLAMFCTGIQLLNEVFIK